MKPDDLRIRMNHINNDRMNLMRGKGQDYADEDALANFKRMQQLCKILHIAPQRSAGDCAMFLVMLKIDRLMNLRRQDKEPANESVRDTVLDGHNYLDLALACWEESSVDLTTE